MNERKNREERDKEKKHRDDNENYAEKRSQQHIEMKTNDNWN